MLTKRKKLSKKEIKEDKLVLFYYKSIDYFTENKSRIFMYVGALVVLIFAVAWYINHSIEQNEAAGLQLSRVITAYDNGNYLEAIEGQQGTEELGLKKIVEQYGSTENGETAKIYLANSYNRLGKSDEALKYYEDYDGSIDMYKATSLAGQAGYYASKNQNEKAADLYKEAARISKSNVLNPDYLLSSGINYIKASKNEKAKEVLETLKKDYRTSTAAREVDKYMVQVN